jgi:hypothetical protein
MKFGMIEGSPAPGRQKFSGHPDGLQRGVYKYVDKPFTLLVVNMDHDEASAVVVSAERGVIPWTEDDATRPTDLVTLADKQYMLEIHP